MKNTSIWASLTVLGLGLSLVLGIHTGCEHDEPSDEGINDYFSNNPYQSDARPTVASAPTAAVSVSLSSSIAQAGELINCVASGGTSPFSWSVGTPANGTIAPQPDTRYAVYTHLGTTNDLNNVVVSDASGAVAIATVN